MGLLKFLLIGDPDKDIAKSKRQIENFKREIDTLRHNLEMSKRYQKGESLKHSIEHTRKRIESLKKSIESEKVHIEELKKRKKLWQ